jgi:hypothetical protein
LRHIMVQDLRTLSQPPRLFSVGRWSVHLRPGCAIERPASVQPLPYDKSYSVCHRHLPPCS